MNLLENNIRADPFGKNSEVARFTIDTPLSQFVFHNIMQENFLYTLRFWICSEADGKISVDGNSFSSTTEWKEHAITFLARSTDLDLYFQKNGIYYMCYVKLETGNKVTDWTPAPEDVDSDIEEASKTASNYLNYDSDDGLVIGNLTDETLGRNVQITSEEINIRNGEEVLASFGEDLIELGKNSTSSVIKLCGGAGEISSKTAMYNDYTYNSLVISSDYYAQMKSGNNDVVVSSNGFVRLSASYGVGKEANDVMIYPEYSYFPKRIELANNKGIRGVTTDGDSLSMMYMSSDDDLVIGYGNYSKGLGITRLQGNRIQFSVKTAKTTYKPYYEADLEDSIADTWRVNGFVTTSKKDICFTIPLGKPVIGNPTIVVTSMMGLKIRQDGKYTHGSGVDTYIEPDSYTAKLANQNCIYITARVTEDLTNAVNNATCAVVADISIDFE